MGCEVAVRAPGNGAINGVPAVVPGLVRAVCVMDSIMRFVTLNCGNALPRIATFCCVVMAGMLAGADGLVMASVPEVAG